jgi:CRP/FNR family cyclic AMP-dependent transcriptional regulator
MPALTTNDLLRRVSMFARLSAQALDELASQVRKVRFERGEVMLQQGGRTNQLIVLIHGTAIVLRQEGSKEVHLATLEAGGIAGEMSLLDGQPHSATVRAETAVHALVLDRQDFLAQLPEPTSLAYEVMLDLVVRLRAANEKIQQLALTDLTARVRSELLAQSVVHQGRHMIQHRIDKPGIAKRVGSSREAVSRVIRRMLDVGELVEQDGVVWLEQHEESPPPTNDDGL